MGTQPIIQRINTFAQAWITYDFVSYVTAQNGAHRRFHRLRSHPAVYSRWALAGVHYPHGRSLSGRSRGVARPHELECAYNPGNPYLSSATQLGFGTFGPPDFAGTVGEVANRRHKPHGSRNGLYIAERVLKSRGLTHLIKTGQGSFTDVTLSSDLFFPKDWHTASPSMEVICWPSPSPKHRLRIRLIQPAICRVGRGGSPITVSQVLLRRQFRYPQSYGGRILLVRIAPAIHLGTPSTVNGELNKLGLNVSFGHGLHAAIHYRSVCVTNLLDVW